MVHSQNPILWPPAKYCRIAISKPPLKALTTSNIELTPVHLSVRLRIFRHIFQVHAGANLPDIQRTVHHRAVYGFRQRDALLDGNMFGCVFRGRVHGASVVGRMSVKVHGLLRPVALHPETNLHNW